MGKELKRILMFHGTDVCRNTLNLFSDAVAKELRKKGIEVGFVELYQDDQRLLENYDREMGMGFDAAIAFNAAGQQSTTIGGVNVFDYMEVPFFNWLVDHPCDHVTDVESGPDDYHVICIDRDHVDFVNKYFDNIAGSHFIPLGGWEMNVPMINKEDFSNREYDFIYTAGTFPLENIIDKIRTMLPDNIQKVALDMIDIMLDDRSVNNESALRMSLDGNGIEVPNNEFKDYAYITSMTNLFVRTYVRDELIAYIADAGIGLHLFGNGWEKLEDKGNIILHGSVSYEESVKLCEKAKLSLNVMPWFKDGIHDRIPTAMLGGSAVLTDTTGYLKEKFIGEGDGQDILFYDISRPDMVGEIIREIQNDKDRLYEIAMNGQKKAANELTWSHRVDELIGVINASIG